MEKRPHSRLILPSGCLTMEALELFHKGDPGIRERSYIEEHLSSCPFCKKGYEGLVSSGNFEDHKTTVEKIRLALHSQVRQKSTPGKPAFPGSARFGYIAAAASILLLAGMFSIFTLLIKDHRDFVAEETGDAPDITDTLLHEPVPDLTESITATGKSKKETAASEEPENAGAVYRKPVVSALKGLKESDTQQKADSIVEFFSVIADVEQATPDVDSTTILEEFEAVENEVLAVDPPAQADIEARRTVSGAQSKNAAPAALGISEMYDEISESAPQFFTDEYENFNAYIQDRLVYPDSAYNTGMEGVVFIEFEITKKGRTRQPKVLVPVHPLLDKEALRLVKESPKWIPAHVNNRPVDSKIRVQIPFKIQ